jgi:hypothetical protein
MNQVVLPPMCLSEILKDVCVKKKISTGNPWTMSKSSGSIFYRKFFVQTSLTKESILVVVIKS